MAPRQRLSAEVRRRQILDAAAELVLVQGYLPLPLDTLAARVGVSKGLIYEYFPVQAELFNTLLAEEEAALEAAGLAAAIAKPDLLSAAHACADIYLRRVAQRGPLAHFVLRDAYMAGRLAPGAVRVRDRFLRAFARRARRELRLQAAEALATVLLVQAIPEEMGRLVWQGDIPLDRGRELAEQLVTSAIAALRPAHSGSGG